MITPTELLDFAFHLAMQPKLSEPYARRAVSACYYSLFHMVAQTGAELFTGDDTQRQRLARSYDHGALARAAERVEKPSRDSGPDPVIAEQLPKIARAIRRLREAREQADYNLARDFSWEEVEELFWEAFNAHDAFQQIKANPATIAFLLDPLIRDRTRRG